MAEQKRNNINNRWNWEVTGFEPRKSSSSTSSSFEEGDHRTVAHLLRRYSISTASFLPHSQELSKQTLSSKVQRLKDEVKHAKEQYLELRQEAIDLQEYSNAKLERVTRYLGVLAEKSRKLDQFAIETEARISPLILEKKRLFNELLTAKGNIKVFCRARPLFEDEGSSIVEFPDDCTIRVNTGDDNLSNPKKDFEFDRVYGPHVGQAALFSDVQPFVQSTLDGSNVSIFAYGQTHAGKTYTMEGTAHDRGLYVRSFEELFDLANSDSTSTSRFNFSVSVLELYNEQIRDLLSESRSTLPKIHMGFPESVIELVQIKVDNPLEFSGVVKSALQNRGNDKSKFNVTHMIVSIHIYYSNTITGENVYSKLSLIDLAGSEGLTMEDDSGEHVTDLLHVMKSISALGDVLSSLTSKKDAVPYENSILTRILADSLGGSSKSLMIVNICPSARNLSETISCLNYAARARNVVPSLGNRDTIKKWRDVANDARKELFEKGREIQDLKQEVVGLKQALKEANDQCVLLYNEVQRAWRVSFMLQSDLKSENTMLTDKYRIEKEQNVQLRSQIAQLLQSEQEQKLQIQQKDYTIRYLQDKIKGLESQLSEAFRSDTTRSGNALGSQSSVSSVVKAAGDMIDSSSVTKKLEEELKKHDALIEKLHEENEKLFDRLTERSMAVSTQISNPLSKASAKVQSADVQRRNSMTEAFSPDAVALPSSAEKNDGMVSLVKASTDRVKSTPAGEYLTAALNDFDPEQYEGFAAIADGANKLLMLVLAAVIKAGASREHEILAEIGDAVFSFIRKMEARRVMDTMLVSRVRILYIRSLLARSPELQSIKVSHVEFFLEKPGSRSRGSSRSSSPGRSPVRYVSEPIQGFKVNIKPEKKNKLVSVVSRIRGHEQDAGRQQVSGGKLQEIQDEAKIFAIGNKALAALFVHTPAGELQRQIRSWLAENFEFLFVSANDVLGGTTGQLELLSTAIMDGWMAGLGAASPPHTDALGQLLSEYAKQVYNSQLQHLKDIAGTLATEEAGDAAQVVQLRSALESIDHKRRKILDQMRSDATLLALGEGSSPVPNPSTAAQDLRLASLISLDSILKQVKDIAREASGHVPSKSKKKALLASVDELTERMSSLLVIDHQCARREIATARQLVESVPVEEDDHLEPSHAQTTLSIDSFTSIETNVSQWNVLQFNTGSTASFIIKCGANSDSELVIKADARIREPKGGEILRVVPRPSVLENMDLEEMRQVFARLPEGLSLLALARTADGTRARYSRLYRTLAMKVPSLRDLVGELEKEGMLKDVKP